MINTHKIYIYITIIFCGIFMVTGTVKSQGVAIDASKLVPKAEISFSPRTGSFVEGSTFEVPILINTKGSSVNSIEVKISYDRNLLSIVKPANGSSVIGVWVEPPRYDNSKGTASYVGVIPGGITTQSGLIGTITFKALKTGVAQVKVGSESVLLLNNGMGTEISFNSIPANYTIIPKAPEGLRVYSETHPYSDNWYNNKSPVISWDSENSVDGYSFELDNKPTTIPDNTIDTTDNIKGFDKLDDGLWYFHIKAIKRGVWGTTSHFLVKIDTVQPAEFTPEANYVVAATVLVERTLISFFTTDNLSGIDHYEVGVIDKSQPVTTSPVFIESESPFQVPLTSDSSLRVIVRAIDKAGNVRDVSIDVKQPLLITRVIKDYLVYILVFIILSGLIGLIVHYTVGHHVIKHLKEFRDSLKSDHGDEDNIPK
jgi:hypothetical protein